MLRFILSGEFFPKKFHIFFAQFFNLPDFPDFLSKYIREISTFLTFWPLENFSNGDRTPTYIDTYLHLFTKFEDFGQKALRYERALFALNKENPNLQLNGNWTKTEGRSQNSLSSLPPIKKVGRRNIPERCSR